MAPLESLLSLFKRRVPPEPDALEFSILSKLPPELLEDDPERLPSANETNRVSLREIIDFAQSAASNLLPLNSIPYYFQHPAFLPSISLSLLYFTVLSFSGQMITFLLAIGYTSYAVGAARAVSTIFELSATWIAPKVQQHIGAVRGGIWFLTWQMI